MSMYLGNILSNLLDGTKVPLLGTSLSYIFLKKLG